MNWAIFFIFICIFVLLLYMTILYYFLISYLHRYLALMKKKEVYEFGQYTPFFNYDINNLFTNMNAMQR